MWIVCITSVRHVLTVNGYGGRQTKENEKSWCFKGWETLVSKYWKYSFEGHRWKECEGVVLKEEELEVLRLSAAGFTMNEIAERMYRSLDSIKTYKRHAFERLGVANITEAISRAELNKLF